MLLLVAVTVAVETAVETDVATDVETAVETDVKTEVEIDVETEVTAEVDELVEGVDLPIAKIAAAAIIIITITTIARTVLPIPARLNNFKLFSTRTHHIYAFLSRKIFNCLANPDSLLGESPGLHSESFGQV